MDHWTPEDIQAYRDCIKNADASRERAKLGPEKKHTCQFGCRTVTYYESENGSWMNQHGYHASYCEICGTKLKGRKEVANGLED